MSVEGDPQRMPVDDDDVVSKPASKIVVVKE